MKVNASFKRFLCLLLVLLMFPLDALAVVVPGGGTNIGYAGGKTTKFRFREYVGIALGIQQMQGPDYTVTRPTEKEVAAGKKGTEGLANVTKHFLYNANLYPALLSCYADYQDQWNIYYADFQSDSDQAGDLRVGPATYLGEIYPDETTTAVAYQVCYTFYTNGSRGLEWHANFEVVVLGFNTHTGDFISLLGRADFEPQGMSIEEIINKATQP